MTTIQLVVKVPTLEICCVMEGNESTLIDAIICRLNIISHSKCAYYLFCQERILELRLSFGFYKKVFQECNIVLAVPKLDQLHSPISKETFTLTTNPTWRALIKMPKNESDPMKVIEKAFSVIENKASKQTKLTNKLQLN